MAAPPIEVPSALDPADVIRRVRAWTGMVPFQAWRIEPGDITAFGGAPTRLRLLMKAEPGAVAGLDAAVEVPHQLLLEESTGAIFRPDHESLLLRRAWERVHALAREAAADAGLAAWIAENAPVFARYDDVGGSGRLSLRGGATTTIPARIYQRLEVV